MKGVPSSNKNGLAEAARRIAVVKRTGETVLNLFGIDANRAKYGKTQDAARQGCK